MNDIAAPQLDLAPGFYAGIPASRYHADRLVDLPTLSSSVADILLNRSARHAFHAHPRLNPNFRHDEPTKEMDLGTVAHAMLLEGSQKNVVIVEANDWRTKEAQTKRDEARAEDKTPILQRHFFAVKRMVDAAREQLKRTEIRGMFETGSAEMTAVWQDGPAWCRSRQDWISADRGVIVDYKTTENAEPAAFLRMILRMGYDVQCAFYSRGVEALTGKAPKFLFLAQETEPPYLISLTALDPAWLAWAHAKVAAAIEVWTECMATERWPGYSARVCYGSAPGWAETQFAEREAQQIDWGSQA